MLRIRLLAALAVTGTLGCSTASAAGPPAALARAVERTSTAESMNLMLTERVAVGSQTVTLELRGIDQPRAKAGSFVFRISPAQAGLGKATEIVHGSRVYVHYPLLDTLHAKNPRVKSWILLDTNSSLGVDPASLTALSTKELSALKGVTTVGGGTLDGVPVTRYQGRLDLRRAASFKQLQQLLAHLPSVAAKVLDTTEQIEFAVGKDGYVHRVTSSLTVPVGNGEHIAISIVVRQSNFDHSTGAIVPPPPASVMTLAEFDRLVGAGAPAAEASLLGKISLKPAQVGRGYTLSQIPGGKLVQGEVTLDFCGRSYPSEVLRTARLQVVYTSRSSAFKASNEVVAYQPGGAKQALGEVTRAAASCASGPVANPPSGVTSLTRRIRVVHDSHLLPGSVAILDVETGTVNGKRVTVHEMEVYQARGDVLSATYGTAASDAAAERETLHAAEQSARNLERYVPAAGAPIA